MAYSCRHHDCILISFPRRWMVIVTAVAFQHSILDSFNFVEYRIPDLVSRPQRSLGGITSDRGLIMADYCPWMLNVEAWGPMLVRCHTSFAMVPLFTFSREQEATQQPMGQAITRRKRSLAVSLVLCWRGLHSHASCLAAMRFLAARKFKSWCRPLKLSSFTMLSCWHWLKDLLLTTPLPYY